MRNYLTPGLLEFIFIDQALSIFVMLDPPHGEVKSRKKKFFKGREACHGRTWKD